MGSFINRKKEKIFRVLNELDFVSEEAFISKFKEMYPDDWKRIWSKWQEEENDTPPGKRHPMQHPDVYMKEMYRNFSKRIRKIHSI